MLLRQSLKACSDVMELVNFVQDSLKSHGYALFTGAKGKETPDGLLSSEDLNEEKDASASVSSISHAFVR